MINVDTNQSVSRLLLFFYYFVSVYSYSNDKCSLKILDSEGTCPATNFNTRYVLYDVNPYEGFNLRRDVYMRLATFFHKLKDNDGIKYQLVLPPWSNLPHWRSKQAGDQSSLPWSLFFDLQSLQNYIPVIEFFEFFKAYGETPLDHVITLQHYSDLWSGNFTWEDQWDITECQQASNYELDPTTGLYIGSFLGFKNSAKNVKCISFHGSASFLKNVLDSFKGRSLAFEHAEIVLHDFYGGYEFWKCRTSMKFSADLVKIASNFIESELGPVDFNSDNVTFFEGGSYLCVHLRRKDYVYSRPDEVPDIFRASEQIKIKLEELKLDSVFVASDAIVKEIEEFRYNLLPFKSVKYTPNATVLQKYKDGGVAIIDQIVCSYSRYFIGSYESTFSFRIQEERELLNFHPNTTFNRLCGNYAKECKQPTKWLKIGNRN